MKLKRFLLRYEPPGIGLEVEEEGECEVHHKNLPPPSQVLSAKEVNGLVDELIAGEPTLLTRRRHRAALSQLLGRLYQIELEPTDDEADASARGVHRGDEAMHAASTAAVDTSLLQEGQHVVIIGLSGKLQVCNGEMGTLVKVRGDKNKFEVLLNSSRVNEQVEPLKVRGAEHIVPLAPKGTPLAVGTHVVIRGLRNHIELNGCLGRVVESHEESHRFEVRATESGQLFRVKQDNLVPIESCGVTTSAAKENRDLNLNMTPRTKKEGAAPLSLSSLAGGNDSGSLGGDDEILEPGSTVMLVGLKTATVYNGQAAEVLSVDRARSRYEIRLKDGSVKTIRAENVRFVSGPTQSTPRSRRQKDGSAVEPRGPSSSGRTSDRGRG